MKKNNIIILLLLIAFSMTAKAQLHLEGKHDRSIDFRGTWGVRILLPTAYDIAFPDGSGINAENFVVDEFMQKIDQLTTITHVNINIHRGHQASWYSSPYPEMAAIMGDDLFPERDFFGEVLDALKQRGLKVMVYFSRTGMDSQYLTAAQMNTWNSYLADEGLTHYEGVAKIIEYYAVKFGDKIDGWWIDRAGAMSTAEHELFARAVRTGNEDAMVAFHVKTGIPIRQGTKFCDYTAGHPVAVNTQPTWTPSNVGMVENIEAGPFIDMNGNPDPSEGTALGSILMPFQRKWRDGAADFPTDMAIEWTIRAMAGGGMYSWAIAREGNNFAAPQFSQLLDINAAVDDYLNDRTGNVTGVSVSPDEKDLFVDDTMQLAASILPFHADNKAVSWVSDNTAVATVSEDGLVTAIAVGSATITVTTEEGGFTATSTITVLPESDQNLALNKTATQSATASGGVASRAVDGDTNGSFGAGSVIAASANADGEIWWQVDLGDEYNIDYVNIFNRTNSCCTNRLTDFYLSVIDANGNVTYKEQIVTNINPSASFSTGGALGRIVRIDSNIDLPLNMAELEVYGSSTLSTENEKTADKFLVYPNPTSDNINIDIRNSQEASYSIVNYTGQILLSGVVKNGTTSIDISGLSSGFYLVRISNEYQTVSKKIVKN